MPQTFPHAPQLLTLVVRFTQTPAALPPPPGPPPPVAGQRLVPLAQTHAPPVHVAPVGQAVPQAPQFCAFVLVSTQTVTVFPPGPVSEHAVSPVSQPVVQAPETHVSSPVQRLPQAPQFALLLDVSTHWLLHVARPPPHAHAPDAQLAPEPQTLLQAPQLFGSVCVSTHAPPQVVWPASASQEVVHWPLEHTPPSHVIPQPPQLFGSLEVS